MREVNQHTKKKRGVLQGLALVSVVAALMLCGQSGWSLAGMKSSSSNKKLRFQALQGAWQKPCQITPDQDVIQYSLQIDGESWVWFSTGFEKAGCESPYLSLIETKKAIFTDTGTVDLTLIKVEYLPRTAGVASTLNSIQFCGLSHWQSGVPQEVSGLSCGDLKLPQRGDVLYTFFKEEVSSSGKIGLAFGVKDAIFDGTSPEKRHKKLDSDFYYKANTEAFRHR